MVSIMAASDYLHIADGASAKKLYFSKTLIWNQRQEESFKFSVVQ